MQVDYDLAFSEHEDHWTCVIMILHSKKNVEANEKDKDHDDHSQNRWLVISLNVGRCNLSTLI